jgi:hypothetical protein
MKVPDQVQDVHFESKQEETEFDCRDFERQHLEEERH